MEVDFSINFENSAIGELESTYIKSFSLVEDIYKLYAGAKLIIKDVLYSFRNQLSLGQDVTVTLKEEGKSYISYMKILSIEPITENGEFVNELALTLISNWYFTAIENTSCAYTGNIGTIISQIWSEHFSKDTLHLKSSIYTTQDPSRIRYQIGERTQDFLKRIYKFGLVDNLPVYLYTDCNSTLNLKGLASFTTGTAKCTLVPDATYKQEISANGEGSFEWGASYLKMNSYSTSIAFQTTSAQETSYFSTKNFITSSELMEKSVMHNSEGANKKISNCSPSKEKNWNWNYLPQDALALSINEYFDKNLEAFSMSGALVGFNLSKISLGGKVKVLLPSESSCITDTLTSSSNPEYIITHIERIFSNNLTSCNFSSSLVNYGTPTTFKPSSIKVNSNLLTQ